MHYFYVTKYRSTSVNKLAEHEAYFQDLIKENQRRSNRKILNISKCRIFLRRRNKKEILSGGKDS